MTTYGYLGPPGTFTEMAVLQYCRQNDEMIPFATIREVVQKIKSGDIDRGIIPLENSLEGSVNLSMDLLFKESALNIIGEIIIPIEHFLLAPAGTKLEDIKEIYSHPQAIAQSGDFIYRYLPEVKINYTESTAGAAEVVGGTENKAMIGSKRITQLYDLNVLAKNIEGDLDNYTRFIVIAGKKEEIEFPEDLSNDSFKTSLICTPEVNRAGVLHEILGEFANRNIDLTRIESRPTKKRLGEYLFFIDLEGRQKHPDLQEALTGVEKKSGFFKILGSYPRGKITRKGENNMLTQKPNQENNNQGWKKLVREEIGKIKPYVPGKPIAEVKEEYNLDHVIKMASNENPLETSPMVLEALQDEMERLSLYPDGATRTLRRDLAKELNVGEDMLTFGNGSDGLLKVIAETFLDSSKQVIISYPSFVEYKFVSQLMGSQLIRVWMRYYHQNMEGIIDAVTPDTKMIFLANPDNPTGTIFRKKDLNYLLENLPDDVLLILDEAYHEYVRAQDYPDGIEYVKAGYPVIVLRTFSKAYGLAGLRLGYAVSCPQIQELLMTARDPFNVNRMAERAGKTALADKDFLKRTMEVNENGKKYLYSEFDRLGLSYVPTEANFILVNVNTDSMNLFKELLEEGIIIRPGNPLGYPNHIRVTIGLPEENEAFIEALERKLSD